TGSAAAYSRTQSGTPQGNGQGRPQICRGRAGRSPSRPPRRTRSAQEARKRQQDQRGRPQPDVGRGPEGDRRARGRGRSHPCGQREGDQDRLKRKCSHAEISPQMAGLSGSRKSEKENARRFGFAQSDGGRSASLSLPSPAGGGG